MRLMKIMKDSQSIMFNNYSITYENIRQHLNFQVTIF